MLSRVWKIRILISLLCVTAIGVFCTSSWDFSLYSFSPLGSEICVCNKCLTEDPWFKERFNAAPQPFLTRAQKTPEDVFNWWKHLQSESRNFTVYQTTVDSLFRIFPHVPDVTEPSPDRCRTCAVVGNSINLKGSHYGPLIDSHDMIIRMNYGPTQGFETDVGTKTTHRVMYPESSSNLDNSTHLVLFPFKIKDLLWLLNAFAPREDGQESKRANKDLVIILNPAFMKYVQEIWLNKVGTYPSTGFLTLIVSLHICDEVSVFGFGADSDGNWSHYFEILKYKNLRTGPHAGIKEYEVIQELQKREKIQFFKGQ